MNKIEKMLIDKKEQISCIKAPDEMESKLTEAFAKEDSKSKNKGNKKNIRGAIAAIIVLAVFFTVYNQDAIAYYSKKIFGYDAVINDSIKELNEMGKGQEIGKSYTFSDGTKVTLDGVMFDDNELNAFFTVENNDKGIDELHFFNRYMKSGFFTYDMRSGSGIINDNKTSVNWVASFEPPNFFTREMLFKFSVAPNDDIKKLESGKIKFKLDRDKALKRTLKISIDESVHIDGNDIYFDSIDASPMSTIINGRVVKGQGNIIEKNSNFDERIRYNLIVNDEIIRLRGSNMSTSNKGITFKHRFEGIKNVQSIKLADIKLVKEKIVDKTIDISTDIKKLALDDEYKISIEKVYTDEDNTYLVINRDKQLEYGFGTFEGESKENINKEIIESVNDNDIFHGKNDDIIQDIWKIESKNEDLRIMIKAINFIKSTDDVIEIHVD